MGFWENFVSAFMKVFNSFTSRFASTPKNVSKLDELSAKALKSFKATNEPFVDIEDPKIDSMDPLELKYLRDDQYLEVSYHVGSTRNAHKKFYLKKRGKEVMIWLGKNKGAFVGEMKCLFSVAQVGKGKDVSYKVSEAVLRVGTIVILPTETYKLVPGGNSKLSKCVPQLVKSITLYQPKVPAS